MGAKNRAFPGARSAFDRPQKTQKNPNMLASFESHSENPLIGAIEGTA